MTTPFDDQFKKMTDADGFIAALDQSGGSTPKALAAYGIQDGAWSHDEEMFAMVHEMRTRIMTSPAFNGERILGAILFENTMDRSVDGKPTSHYLWQNKNIVPFLKVDKGLSEEKNGVQPMKPIPGLAELLERAKSKDVFGTKMRSVIKQADHDGVSIVVEQQFEFAQQIAAAGLIPIIEPEIDIHCPDKAGAERLLRDEVMTRLDRLAENWRVMLKLTIPEEPDFYRPCMDHPQVVRVVALSGGYPRDEANARLSKQPGMVASFSRALAEGLSAQQTDTEFNDVLNASIQSIFDASKT